jgi:hypothetical protein
MAELKTIRWIEINKTHFDGGPRWEFSIEAGQRGETQDELRGGKFFAPRIVAGKLFSPIPATSFTDISLYAVQWDACCAGQTASMACNVADCQRFGNLSRLAKFV